MDIENIQAKFIYSILEDNNYHKENTFLFTNYKQNSKVFYMLFYVAIALNNKGVYDTLEDSILKIVSDFYRCYRAITDYKVLENKASGSLTRMLRSREYDFKFKTSKITTILLFFIDELINNNYDVEDFQEHLNINCDYRGKEKEHTEDIFLGAGINFKFFGF